MKKELEIIEAKTKMYDDRRLSTVSTYVKETNDLSILDETVGYWESDIKETVFEHCIRGVDFLHREVGAEMTLSRNIKTRMKRYGISFTWTDYFLSLG